MRIVAFMVIIEGWEWEEERGSLPSDQSGPVWRGERGPEICE